MRIQLNDEPLECADGLTLAALLAQLGQGETGSALAVNHTLIPRAQWENHLLYEGDTLLLFQVIAGG